MSKKQEQAFLAGVLKSPKAVKALRRQLDDEIRDAFAGFLDICREQLRSEDAKRLLNRDIKTVAGLLAERGDKQLPARTLTVGRPTRVLAERPDDERPDYVVTPQVQTGPQTESSKDSMDSLDSMDSGREVHNP